MNIKFRFPNTRLCLVLWYRNNKPTKTLIETPKTVIGLRDRMLKEKVGLSEIRAVQPVRETDLAAAMGRV